jgi:hypothetical protein
MSAEVYQFSLVEGLRIGRRAVGFLEDQAENSSLNAKVKFDSLRPPKDRDVRRRFDHWLEFGIKDNWFHGWPNDGTVKGCFSFRWEEKGRQHHRFYGFLYHPQPKTFPSRQICVLAYHDVKTDLNTNRTLLIRSMGLRANVEVRKAIAFVFEDVERPQERRPIQ